MASPPTDCIPVLYATTDSFVVLFLCTHSRVRSICFGLILGLEEFTLLSLWRSVSRSVESRFKKTKRTVPGIFLSTNKPCHKINHLMSYLIRINQHSSASNFRKLLGEMSFSVCGFHFFQYGSPQKKWAGLEPAHTEIMEITIGASKKTFVNYCCIHNHNSLYDSRLPNPDTWSALHKLRLPFGSS